MFNNIAKEIKYCYKDILMLMIVPLCAWILGEIISLSIITISNETLYFTAGSIMAFVSVIIVAVVLPVSQFLINYNLIVSMSRTRKHFLIGMSITVITEVIALLITAVVVSQLSYIVKFVFYKNMPFENFSGIITLDLVLEYIWALPLAIIGFLAFNLITCALIKKFSVKVLWAYWGVYMCLTIGAASLESLMNNLNRIHVISVFIQSMSNFAPIFYIILSVILVLIALIISVKYLLKASV